MSKHTTKRNVEVAHVCLFLISLSFSFLNVLAARVLHNRANPVTFGVYRDCGAFLVLLVGTHVLEGLWRPPSLFQVLHIAAIGVLGIYATQMLYLLGVSLTSDFMVSLYQPLTPILAALISMTLLRQEPWSWWKILGVLLGGGGVLLVVTTTSHGGKVESSLWGNLINLGSATASAFAAVGVVPLYKYCGPMNITLWEYGFGGLAMLMTSTQYAWKGDAGVWSRGLESAEAVGTLVFAAVVCSAMNYSLMTWTIKQVGATVVCLYAGLQPFGTAAIAYLWHGEPVLWQHGAGAVLVGLGLFASTRGPAVEVAGEARDDDGHQEHHRPLLHSADEEQTATLSAPEVPEG